MEQQPYQDLSDKVGNVVDKAKYSMGKAVFDIVAVALFVALFFLSFGEIVVSNQSMMLLIGNTAFMFIFAILLDSNYLMKGNMRGKSSPKYIDVIADHSAEVEKLSGEDLSKLPIFCQEFVEAEETRLRAKVLKSVAISEELYNTKLVTMGKRELAGEGLTKVQVKAVIRAQRVTVKPLHHDELLSEITIVKSSTDLGMSEHQLKRSRLVKDAVSYLLWAFIMAYFTVRLAENFSIAAFGWYLGKVTFLAMRCVYAFYSGFNMVTNNLRFRILKKIDIIKQFIAWKCKPLEAPSEKVNEGINVNTNGDVEVSLSVDDGFKKLLGNE